MSNQNESVVPDALRNFDYLPDAASVRLPVVCALTGAAPNTVWRMSKDGRLPAPRKMGLKITAWNVGELRQKLNGLRLSSTAT